MRNKPLGIALILSLVIHSLVFVVLPGIGINFNKDHGDRVEVVYSPFTLLEPLSASTPVGQASRPPGRMSHLSSQTPNLSITRSYEQKSRPVENAFSRVTKESPIVGQASRPPGRMSHLSSQTSMSIVTSDSKQASPPVRQSSHLSIDSNPFVPTSAQEGIAYMNYFEALRNKIQESVRYPKEWSIGEVYVSFIIKSDGSLKLDAINVLEKSSTTDRLLREASVQTIIAAAPFPPFPKGLNRQEICFNIPIVYKSGK